MLKYSAIYHAVFVLWMVRITGAVVFDPATEAKVRSYVESTMRCRKVPGMTVAFIKGNDTWTSGFGIADVDTGRQVKSQSMFAVGSCSKAFTMTLLGMLLEENGFTWSSKVSEVMGYEFKFGDDLRTKETTIKDLLSHRTGLARLDIALLAGYTANMTTRAELSRRIQFLPLRYEFRDKFLYNNFLYMLLGFICEVLGKDTWENLVTSRLLTPIGMTSSTVMRSPNDAFSGRAAHPHNYRDGRFEKGNMEIYGMHPFEPAGAVLSSADDMAKWIRFNMRRGQLENGTQLVKEKLLDEAISVTTAISSSSRDFSQPEFPASNLLKGYGYAWFASSYRGYKRYWHSGGWFSYITYLWIFPDTNVGLFASVNGPGFESSDTLKSIMYYVSDLLLGEETWMNETTACTYPEPWREKKTMSSSTEETGHLATAQEYLGMYGHRFLPDIRISAMPGETNKLRFDSNRLLGQLRPSKDTDRFLYEVTSPLECVLDYTRGQNVTKEFNVTFIRNDGRVTGATISLEVDVTFTKGMSFSDPFTNGTPTIRETCVGYIIVWSLISVLLVGIHRND